MNQLGRRSSMIVPVTSDAVSLDEIERIVIRLGQVESRERFAMPPAERFSSTTFVQH